MICHKNPFTSDIYIKEWEEHFSKGKKAYRFEFITGIAFTKNKYIPLYINVGKYKTMGISYQLQAPALSKDFRGKAFLIYDVPEYFEVSTKHKNKKLGILKTKQYEGFLIDLRPYNSLKHYLQTQFNSKRRHNLLSRLRKLENNHDISYEYVTGKVPPDKFKSLFEDLYGLIEQQYISKGKLNSHYPQKIKDWHYSLFPKLLDIESASFHLIKDGETTIASCFNYEGKNVHFSFIPALNPEYAKFGLGNVRKLKSIGWAIKNGFDYFDLGKGSYGYKQRWSTRKYRYQHHILFDKRSIHATLCAYFIFVYFSLKQIARQIKYRLL